MSDIFSNFLSCNSTLNRNNYKNKFSEKSNKIFLDNGLRLSKEGNILKLPKLNLNNRFITENYKNKSYDNLDNAIKNNNIIIINNTDTENNRVFKNQYLSDMNTKNINLYKKKNHNQKKGKVFNEQQINNNYKKTSKSNNKSLNNKNKILTIDNNNIISEKEKAKQKFINDYINSLLTKGKEKYDKFSEATKKIESNKYSLANSINPKKYIQKKILDDSFNYNEFRTSRIQKDCFNGNEKFRKANYKNITINMMNNIFLNSMSAPLEETRTKFLIDQMIAEQNHINKFHFGKNMFNRKDGETINSNNN